ncbi:raffinose/stachyose/melibiose transport system substrate-binding protein [Paenibacillus jamilae]|jgi:raffinose/stachyose/melibiose transport system substrate-binding protein|uniref:ABC transporter substrate-binding protein n=1 Tax=Paenibacillus TaxID=44249 RepID=UPI000304662C|nr:MULTISPECIES: extracellular solute-binding protein [Paenibacillus]MDP9678891.1 raffinose/stachyose/melibiose transport system substrate-binding protein [Paenibacillus jamilae]KAF6582471.1 extracellular solute-binding protein [Paenibacillus sp. EKM211P]KAF6615183.1 extracellular solute-binding protein [Paenibacillus sp. EKM101P]KAF6618785.1 extracellular solute-binding protein [Paenibacillus sp. EKM102P]KAF6627194.1 extracellular solute-binding protein [Paenibacillus sp. EKM10P]
MKMWKGVLSTMLVGTLLAGCGANSSGSDSSGSGGDGKTVNLKMFIAQPRLKEHYDKYINAFVAKEKKDKNIDVTVQLEMPPADNAAQILKTRLASNDAPDVFALHAVNEIPPFYKAGYLEDLSGQPFVSKLMDSVKPSVTTQDGKVVAVPLETISWGYLYNKKIFKDLDLKPPGTLTEMKAVVEKLKANHVKPFLLSYKESWIPQLFVPLTAGAMMNTQNKDFIERMNQDKGSFSEMKSMFDIIDLVNSNGTDKALEIGGDDGSAAFASGKAAMWIQGPWFAETILKSDPKMDFGVAPLPINDDPNATLINLSTSTSLAVSSTSKNKEVALDFVNYVLDDKDSSAFYEALKFNPISKVHTFKSYPWVNDATEYVKAGKSYQDPSIPQAVKDEAGKSLQSYYAGQLSQDDVIKALDKAWKSYNKVNK